jgi:ketosteroid isomerase-like protein
MITDERELLRAVDKEWSAVARQGADVDRIVSFWSDDAKVYPPGAPILEGQPAIRDFVAASLKIDGFSVSWEPAEVVVGSGGTIGYTTGRNRFTLPDASGNETTSEGRYVTVWRKDADGAWRCTIDIWNNGPHESA